MEHEGVEKRTTKELVSCLLEIAGEMEGTVYEPVIKQAAERLSLYDSEVLGRLWATITILLHAGEKDEL